MKRNLLVFVCIFVAISSFAATTLNQEETEENQRDERFQDVALYMLVLGAVMATVLSVAAIGYLIIEFLPG